jgi:hypothetical protein
MHQVLCKLSNDASDVRCTICGQGFLVYWSRFSRPEQEVSRRLIQDSLRNQHAHSLASGEPVGAHPRTGFNVPEWSGVPDFSAAALLSGVTAHAY